MKKILIVEDHPLTRKGLVLTLDAEPGLSVSGQVSSAEEALDVLETLNPDLVIVDMSLPGMNGIELVKQMQSLRPEIPTLVVSYKDEMLYAERALRAGAQGYVMKVERSEVILKAVRRVLAGSIYLSEEMSERLLFRLVTGQREIGQSPGHVLSDRELEVFELFGQGLSTREIAERLYLSVKTIESYRTRIKEKLYLKTATELLQHAVRWIENEGREE